MSASSAVSGATLQFLKPATAPRRAVPSSHRSLCPRPEPASRGEDVKGQIAASTRPRRLLLLLLAMLPLLLSVMAVGGQRKCAHEQGGHHRRRSWCHILHTRNLPN